MPDRYPSKKPRPAGAALIPLLVIFVIICGCSKDKPVAAPAADASAQAAVIPASELQEVPVEAEPSDDASGDALAEARAALSAGDLERAEGILRDNIASGRPVAGAAELLAAAMNRRALAEANSGETERAVAILEEAAGHWPAPVLLRNLSELRIKAGRLPEAADALESIRGEPGVTERLKEIYSALGRMSSAKGDPAGAAVYLRKALDLDPSDGRLSAALAQAEKEGAAESGMSSAEGSRFLVRFEGGENAVAGHLIKLLLEEAYLKVGSDLGFYPEERIEALLYSREAFRDITRSPEWTGAIYDGRIKIPAGGLTQKTGELERVIFHEYTHALVAMLAKGRAPVWLNEGIAQYEEGGTTAGQAGRLKELAQSGRADLKRLEGSFMRLSAEDASAAYLLSLSAVEYMARDFGMSSVQSLMKELGAGSDIGGAIESALRVSYPEFEALWREGLLR